MHIVATRIAANVPRQHSSDFHDFVPSLALELVFDLILFTYFYFANLDDKIFNQEHFYRNIKLVTTQVNEQIENFYFYNYIAESTVWAV